MLRIRPHARRAGGAAGQGDLRTDMVGEFPSCRPDGPLLRQHDGEPPTVARDRVEHSSRVPTTSCPPPRSAPRRARRQAETLVGLFGIGEKPTGDKDPFALRRHAIGVLRMLSEKRLPLAIGELLAVAGQAFNGMTKFEPAGAELAAFLYDRLRGLLREQGLQRQRGRVGSRAAPQRIDDIAERLAAVRAFMQLPEAESLAAANKRIGNILKKSAGASATGVTVTCCSNPQRGRSPKRRPHRATCAQLFDAGDYAATCSRWRR